MDNYQQYIATSRYARWLPEKNRRETWAETVGRYVDFFADKISEKDYEELKQAIINLEVMPSMRCLMTAGEALERDNVAGFNCSYLPIDHPRAFDELMYVLMCGTGVGFSVERQFVTKLPEVNNDMHPCDTVIVVADSKIGWATAFKQLIALLYSGQIPKWDMSKIRPSGARLKTFGGRASGPQPLDDLFNFTVQLFSGAVGRRLSSIECHDLVCKVADIVVVGGVRRSALISLSSLEDKAIAACKSIYNVDEYALIGEDENSWTYTLTMKKHPAVHPTYKVVLSKDTGLYDKRELERNKKIGWWHLEPQRALANNSACYTEKPTLDSFMKEWSSLYESKSGERGVFSRVAAKKVAERNGRRDSNFEFGTNPCSEIILRPNQFCNLSEVVVRAGDTIEDLKRKVKIASKLGSLQSTLTNFRYLRPVWKRNTEEECLLGVSLTGIMDHPILSDPNSDELPAILEELKDVAISTNAKYAKQLGVNASTAITCVKPSGTVSQLVDSASGIHPRFSEYYIRTVRGDKKDPLSQLMKEQGVPCEEDVISPSNYVFSFAKKSPSGAVHTQDVGAMEQLKLWKIYQDHWCEHKPSITVYYKDDEFLHVGAWLYNNFDDVSGISFLPYSDHTYKQAPYQEINKEEYEELKAAEVEINFNLLSSYEQEDTTTGTQELACVGTSCEL